MPYTGDVNPLYDGEVRDKEVNELFQTVRKINNRWYIKEDLIQSSQDRTYGIYYYAGGANYSVINWNYIATKSGVIFFLRGLLKGYETKEDKSVAGG